MLEKIDCPSCSKQVAIQTVVCPFCGGQVRSKEDISNDPRVKEAIAKVALDSLNAEKHSSRVSKSRRVTGPISAFMSQFLPCYEEGTLMIVEWILAIISLPFIIINTVVLIVLVSKWGRIPFFDIVMTALLAGIFTYNMANRLYFPLFIVSFIAFSVKTIIRITAD